MHRVNIEGIAFKYIIILNKYLMQQQNIFKISDLLFSLFCKAFPAYKGLIAKALAMYP